MADIDVMHRGDTMRLEWVAKNRGTEDILDLSSATTMEILIRPPRGRRDGSDDETFTADFDGDPSTSSNDGTDGVFGYTLLPTDLDGLGSETDAEDFQWQSRVVLSSTQAWHSDWRILRVLPNLGG